MIRLIFGICLIMETFSFAQNHDLGVYIGRFQPLHLGHLAVIEGGLQRADRLLILLGQEKDPHFPTNKNPWSWQEREEMLKTALTKELLKRIIIEPIFDVPEDENWVKEVRARTVARAPKSGILLIGFHKDQSSSYLKHFSDWTFWQPEQVHAIDATQIRSRFFAGELDQVSHLLHPATFKWLAEPSQQQRRAELSPR